MNYFVFMSKRYPTSRDIVMNIDVHSLCSVLKTPASKRMTEDDNGGKLADFYC